MHNNKECGHIELSGENTDKDEIIARADGPDGLKALTEKANASKKANVSTEKSKEKVPFFATIMA